MKREGPPLETVLRRIVDAPQDFLSEPKIGDCGTIHVDAVAGDVASKLGRPVPRALLQRYTGKDANAANRLGTALLASWIYADDWLLQAGIAPASMLQALDALATELAPQAPARSFHTNAERREELARTALAHLDFRPAGESESQAQDRLLSVSAAERKRLVDAAKVGAARVRAVREALARKAAEESADKMWRE